MNKNIAIIPLILVLFTISFKSKKNYITQKYSQLHFKDTLQWNEKTSLKWNDFKLNPSYEKDQKLKKHKATSYIGINVEIIKEYKDSIVLKVNSYFNRTKSWTKDTSLYLLNHECRHFDIVEFCSRQLKKEILNLKSLSRDTTILKINLLIGEIEKKRTEIQNLYDKETNHSINRNQQEMWNKKINGLLNSTKMYKQQIICVKIKQ